MRKVFLTIMTGLFLVFSGQAQTLENYLREAGENNPDLKARYLEYEAALQKVPQAGALPDPELTFNFFVNPMERFMGNQISEISLMQMFPWFGSLEAGKNEAKSMAQMKFYRFLDTRNSLFHEVRTAYYQLYRNREDLKLLEEELEILKVLEQVALAKYQAGPSSAASSSGARIQTSPPGNNPQGSTSGSSGGMGNMGNMNARTAMGSGSSMGSRSMSGGNMAAGGGNSMVDVLLVRIQIRELENRVRLLQDSRRVLQVTFNNLLNKTPEQPVIVPDTLLPVPLPASLSLIEDSIRQNHPMLKMYEWDEKAREAQLQMAKLMGRPMIGLGVNYMVFKPRFDEMRQMNMGGENMIMPMVTLTLPVYRKKYNAAQKEATLLQQAAGQQKESTKNQLLTDLETLLYDYQRSKYRLELTQEQIALTSQAARLLTTNYSVGNSGIEELVRQRQALIAYKQQQVQAITDQLVAVSAINRMMNLAF